MIYLKNYYDTGRDKYLFNSIFEWNNFILTPNRNGRNAKCKRSEWKLNFPDPIIRVAQVLWLYAFFFIAAAAIVVVVVIACHRRWTKNFETAKLISVFFFSYFLFAISPIEFACRGHFEWNRKKNGMYMIKFLVALEDWLWWRKKHKRRRKLPYSRFYSLLFVRTHINAIWMRAYRRISN